MKEPRLNSDVLLLSMCDVGQITYLLSYTLFVI